MPYFVYRFYDVNENLLYVGQTNDVDARMYAHEVGTPWIKEMHHFTTERCITREGSVRAETEAIRTEFPLYNKHGFGPRRVKRRDVKDHRVGDDWDGTPYASEKLPPLWNTPRKKVIKAMRDPEYWKKF